ncbi:Dihydrolipoyl dehydrogenase [Sporotomaculum syntrophicum]|uniref:Dihydrolipoyl dehydrogenase n=1 Tax=Sporotomaculum syntrophicum TaxID=182264 RepID=A0A9D3AYQ4_9FIRM|nr:dihydrolipoyl dehydrogenase [Sporotomaculum syntrophicum]KAF1085049.1 Dihydrolipoyl dehydrogenase [Sporotomaculum syntrophicum]
MAENAPKCYDVVFLGGGPAGYQGAIRASQLGGRVAVVEQEYLGGVCLNRGCIPTKALRASVEVLRLARKSKSFGINVENVIPNVPAMIARKNRVVELLRGGIEYLFEQNRVDLYQGIGRLLEPGVLEVNEEDGLTKVYACKVVLATGSRTSRPGFLTGEQPGVLTTDDILEMTAAPASLLVLGGGAVGVEMAVIMVELGSKVTLLEREDRILPREDAEAAAYLQSLLKRRKVKVLTGARVEQVQGDQNVTVTLAGGDTLSAEKLLLAAGRKVNAENIGLENIGMPVDGKPLQVDEHMLTGVPGIYAAGDLAGKTWLAHGAFAEGITAAEHALGRPAAMDYRVVPRCVFSTPEFAAVGMSEEEAKAQYNVKSVTFPFRSLGMAQAMGDWEGMVKLVVDSKTEQLLGGHIVGPHAGDLIAEVALAMQNKIGIRGIVETIHTHPTLSEAVLETAQGVLGLAIHMDPVDRS